VRRLVEVSLRLPQPWFEIPVIEIDDEGIVEWASETALSAWKLREAAGYSEEAVFPDAGRNLVVELSSLVLNLREQLAGAQRGLLEAHVLLQLPEMGIVSAVAIAQLAERSTERSPERFVETLESMADASDPQSGDIHRQRLDGDLGGDPLRGLHSMVGHFDPDTGVAMLEERTCFGVFPSGCDEMIEVLFIAERPAAFADMPTETYALLDGLEISAVDAT